MYDWLQRWATIASDRIAIEEVDTGRTSTYAELDTRAEQLAAWWREGLGLEAGSRVAMLCASRTEVFEALFAAAKAQLTLVPLNWRLSTTELARVLDDADPQLLAYDAAYSEAAGKLLSARPVPQVVALDEPDVGDHPRWATEAARASGPRRAPRRGVELEDVPLVLYTSGTTGGPKGVMIPWRQILFNAINTCLAAGLGPEDSTLACLPLFHTGGLHCLATPLLHRGGRVVLTRGFDPEQATRILKEGRASTTIAVPTMYEMMAEAGFLTGDATSVKALLCGGAPLSDRLLDRYHDAGRPLRQGYGLTEVGPNCFTLSPLSGPERRGTVGQPAFHSEAKLVDDDGAEVEPEQPGELWLRGPHVTRGYLGQPDTTRAALTEDGWFRTGDLLSRSERGSFSVVGRKKDMFISGGENVYPAEVENTLAEHPRVASVVVLGVPDARWGQVGLAALILDDPVNPPSAAELTAWARERIARYKVPKHWRFVNAFPLNSTGKVQKPALLEQLAPTLNQDQP